MNKKVALLNVLVFVLFIGGLFFLNIGTEDQGFSPNENRVLASKPKFTIDNLFSGKFTLEYEDYVTDQFVGRDFFVGLKAASEKILWKKANNDVYFSNNGFLLQRFFNINEQIFTKNRNAVHSFITNQSIPISLLLIPSSVDSLASERPNFAYDINQRDIYDSLYELVGPHMIDVFPALQEDASQNYFLTDHHFNLHGARKAYEVFQQKSLPDIEYEVISNDFIGTLYSKSGMYWNQKDQIEKVDIKRPYTVEFSGNPTLYDSLYFEDNINEKDQYKYYLNGNHAQITIQTNQPDKKNILIVRDSFGNIMAPYFIEDYNTIYFYDLRYATKTVSKFIEDNDIDEVLLLYSVPNFTTDRYIENLR